MRATNCCMAKSPQFTRRALILGGLHVAGFSLLAGRLAYLQLFKEEKYGNLAENNRVKLQLIAPERGKLLDWRGEELAANELNFQLYMDMSGFKRDAFNRVVATLQNLLVLPEKTQAMLKNMRLRNSMKPEMLKDHLTWEEVSKIELNVPDLPGVFINLGQIRHYLLGEQAAHLTGYVGTISEADLSADDQPLMRLPDFKIGKNGVEQMLESRLRGTAGYKKIEVDVHGVPVRELEKHDNIPGESVKLTIDKRLQSFTSERMGEESATVVVMDVHSGHILTLASMPAFNPDMFSLGIRTDYWKELNDNKKVPLMNKAISGQYPPGSTFKMLVGMAALEKGIITPSSQVHCPGHFYLGNHRFNCWKEEGHGMVNYKRAVTESCDTFFYTMGSRLGIDPIASMARRLGLGADFDLGMIGEKPGLIPDAAWKMKSYGQKWTAGDTVNCAIGQGYVLSTPLQLCVMMARMVNGGVAVTPTLEPREKKFASAGISDELLKLAMEGMRDVVNAPNGTAYGKRIIDKPEFAFGGKTGTSQVRAITVRGQDQSTIPWEHRHHALFVGYAPVDSPKYACSVLVEHGGGGSAAAAPIARDVLTKLQELISSGE